MYALPILGHLALLFEGVNGFTKGRNASPGESFRAWFQQPRASHRQRRRKWVWAQRIGWLVPLLVGLSPAEAAERISLSYGLVERTIAIESLEEFAESDTIPRELRPYTRYFDAEQVEQFRQILQTRLELSPVAVSEFLYTQQGDSLLGQLGAVVRTESGLEGTQALRAAFVLAAFDEDGLTPLTVLRYFPLDGMRIDLERTSRILTQIQQRVTQTQQTIALLNQQADDSILTEPLLLNFDTALDLERRGRFAFDVESFELKDDARDRQFEVDLYLPVGFTLPEPSPVVVISHGLGSNRGTFAYLARHLASYGFVVAVPEHPGSNTQQLEDLITGRAAQVTEPDEFINRPLDVTLLLDALERRSQEPDFIGRYDTQRVGIIGQSLGGYTAFALAGVPLNRPQLEQDCAVIDPVTLSLNLSLLLQCDVLTLEIEDSIDFQDDRIQAIVAINSVGSRLLDRDSLGKVDIPVMLISGGADTVTPALPEQVEPFARLTTPHRYLLMMENATHFSAIDIPDGDAPTVQLPTELVGPDPAIAHSYINAIGLAFMGYHLDNDDTFTPYLSARYTRYLSQPDLPMALVRALSLSQLTYLQK
ncbi:MAG: alpha/beta hydrolase [Cyanobacteria bacterium J06638_20]